MSAWTAKVIVGVRLSELYVEREIVAEVVKYDEDTGKPKKVKVDQLERSFLGKPLPSLTFKLDRSSCHARVQRDWEFLHKHYLEIHFPFSLADVQSPDIIKHGVVGVEIGKQASTENWSEEINQDDINAAVTLVGERLKAIGYQSEVKIFSQLGVN